MTRPQLAELAWLLGSMVAGPLVAWAFFWLDGLSGRLGQLPVIGGLFRWWDNGRSSDVWYPATRSLVVWGSLLGVALPSFFSCACFVWVTRSARAPFARLVKATLGFVAATTLHTVVVSLVVAPFVGG